MRGTCYTCRRRRIQCSGTRRPCLKCEKAGLECLEERPIRWVKGIAVRGKMRGASFEDLSATFARAGELKRPLKPTAHPRVKPSIERSASMTIDGLERYDPGDRFNNSSPSFPLILGDPTISTLDETARYYLDYYNGRICKLFIVYDSDENPFRSLISLALEDSVLLKALLALAACHKANTSHSFHQLETSLEIAKTRQDALSFKHCAIKYLSSALQDATSYGRDSTVASIFLLIFLDLLESGSDRWNLHLEGAKSLMSSCQASFQSHGEAGYDPGRTVQRIRDFITRQIYLIETLGATFVRPRLLSQYTSNIQVGLSQETLEQSFLGCPEYLLDAIQFFSLKRDLITGFPQLDLAVLSDHVEDTRIMLDSIRIFDCSFWASNLPQPHHSSKRDTSSVCILSESYRIGALIYGERVLDTLTQRTSVHDHLVCELIGLIDALKDDRTLLKCILWPICIAGLECRLQAQREFLISCLEKFWMDTNCLNSINAAKVLQPYWQRVDEQEVESSQWIFTIGCLGADWLLI